MSLSYWPDPADVTVTLKPRRAARGPIAPLGARKPLHLDGRRRAIHVRAAGPALAILRDAQRLELPISRLARVLVCGDVHFDAAAIAACLHHQVPIVFLDGRLRPIGSALPLTGRTSELGELLAAWLDQPGWREQYDSWLRAQRMRVLRCWRQARAAAGRAVGSDEWSEAVRSFVYGDTTEFASPYASGCYARALTVLLRAGVRTQYRGCDGGTLPLAAHLAHLADRSVALQMGTAAHALAAQPHLAARAAEAAGAGVDGLIVDLLARLRRRAAEWIEPWP